MPDRGVAAGAEGVVLGRVATDAAVGGVTLTPDAPKVGARVGSGSLLFISQARIGRTKKISSKNRFMASVKVS